jgi:hypothetical protein
MQVWDETVRLSCSHFPQTEQYSAMITMDVLLQGIRSVLLETYRYLLVRELSKQVQRHCSLQIPAFAIHCNKILDHLT